MIRWYFSLLLLTSLSFSSVVRAENTDAIDILKRMSEAAKTLTYEGVFAYQSGKNLQSIRIYHRADARGELERLISLNGTAREVIRTDDMVTCINPEGKKVNVSRRPLGRGFPSDLPRRLSSAAPFYSVEIAEDDRVAGRQAQKLFISPVDEYRYGYHLWVDKETFLLLKSELVTETGSVLETFEFSSINTDVHISEHKLQPQMNGEQRSWQRFEPEKPSSSPDKKELSQWEFEWLPEGFSLVAFQTRLRSSNGAYVEHRVFSDGLSSISVFIEKIRAQHSHLRGGSHMGGVNAYGKIIASHFLTVVGEVPAKTVEKVGDAIRFSDET